MRVVLDTRVVKAATFGEALAMRSVLGTLTAQQVAAIARAYAMTHSNGDVPLAEAVTRGYDEAMEAFDGA